VVPRPVLDVVAMRIVLAPANNRLPVFKPIPVTLLTQVECGRN